MPQLIINAIGPDRPGIVGQVTGHLHAAAANVLDSRMVNLRGQFALLLLVEADDAAAAHAAPAQIRQPLPPLADTIGLRLTVTDSTTPTGPLPGIPFKLKTYS